jgi:hypothetical protein
MSRAAALLAARLGVSGFFGLDFILERGTGAAFLIEMNPRCTQLGHLPVLPQGDLASAWLAALSGRDRPQAPCSVGTDTIAFFPQAWRWGAQSGDLHTVYHDVPWEERRLVEHLMLEPWPERQWAARAYHWCRRTGHDSVIEFPPPVLAARGTGADRTDNSGVSPSPVPGMDRLLSRKYPR